MKRIALLVAILVFVGMYSCLSLAEPQTVKSTVGNIYITKVKNVGSVQEIQSFYEGKAGFLTDDGWGIVDTRGSIVIPPCYHGFTCFSDGVIGAQMGTSWFLLDEQGNRVSDMTYLDLANGFSEGLCAAKKNGKWGFIDRTGQFVFDPVWESAHNFREGVAAVKINGKWGYIDTTGEYAIAPEWDGGRHNSSSSMSGKELGDVSGTGNYGTPDDVGDFYDGLAVVTYNGQTAFINHDGEIAIPFEDYESVGFNEGLAQVVNPKEGRGYINTDGEYVIPMNMKWNGSCALFNEGVAPIQEVTMKGLFDATYKAYYIDRNGKRTGKRDWEYTASVREGIGIGIKNGKCYYIDKSGEPIMTNQKYTSAIQFNEGHALAVDASKGLVVLSLQDPAASAAADQMSAQQAAEGTQESNGFMGQIKITGKGNVNVRREANAQSDRVGTVKSGNILNCLSISDDGWYEIILPNGKTGFVSPKLAKPL